MAKMSSIPVSLNNKFYHIHLRLRLIKIKITMRESMERNPHVLETESIFAAFNALILPNNCQRCLSSYYFDEYRRKKERKKEIDR